MFGSACPMKIYQTFLLYFLIGLNSYGCGQKIRHTRPTGTILSHKGYPNLNYPSRLSLRHLIVAPDGMAIALRINDFLLDSTFDYLKLKPLSQKGMRFEGNSLAGRLPHFLIFNVTELRLKFVTDSRGNDNPGFSIDYAFVNTTAQCDTNNLRSFVSEPQRLDCDFTLNYASNCTILEGDIYRRDMKCVDGSYFNTTNLKLDDDLVQLCEENETLCRYEADDMIEYYMFSVSVEDLTKEELQELEYREENLDIEVGKSPSKSCRRWCRKSGITRNWAFPKFCRSVARWGKRKLLRRCVTCRISRNCVPTYL